MSAEARLAELGIELPAPFPPAGEYVNAVRTAPGTLAAHSYRTYLFGAALGNGDRLAWDADDKVRAYPASVIAGLCRWGQFAWRIERSPFPE